MSAAMIGSYVSQAVADLLMLEIIRESRGPELSVSDDEMLAELSVLLDLPANG